MELKRAIEIIADICDKSDCHECPLHDYFGENLCKFDDCDYMDVDKLESILIKWEKDHQKHYPTWKQWVRGQYPLGQDSIMCPRKFLVTAIDIEECNSKTCEECYDSEISESAAKILGVKPIERKDD